MKLEICKNKEVEEITDVFYIVFKLFEILDEKQQKSTWIKRFKRCYRFTDLMDIEVILDNNIKMVFYDVPCKTGGSIDVYKILGNFSNIEILED